MDVINESIISTSGDLDDGNVSKSPISAIVLKEPSKLAMMKGTLKSVRVEETVGSQKQGVRLYSCPVCSKSFVRKSNANRHLKTHSGEKPYVCDFCLKGFARKSDLYRHKKVHKSIKCRKCGMMFSLKIEMQQHKKVSHPSRKRVGESAVHKAKRIKKVRKVGDIFASYSIVPSKEISSDLVLFYDEWRPQVEKLLTTELDSRGAIKWYAIVSVIMVRRDNDGESESINMYFRGNCLIEMMSHTIDGHIEQTQSKIIKSFEGFTQRGSGWTLDKINKLELFLANYRPFASSKEKGVVVNV